MAWITAAEVAARLGPTTPADDPVIASVTEAAVQHIAEQRAAAGWTDDIGGVVPTAAVREACVLYAVSLYRDRAATGEVPAYTELEAIPSSSAIYPRVKGLARFPRPAVG